MTAQRINYDDESRNPDPQQPAAPPPPSSKKQGGGWLKTLLLAGGAAVAGAIAVDMYRKHVKGEKDPDDRQAPPNTPQLAMANQTFVPMPIPMPMPMPMPGYGGYGAPPPERNPRRTADEEEELMREEAKKIVARKRVIKDLNRERIDQMAAELLEDD